MNYAERFTVTSPDEIIFDDDPDFAKFARDDSADRKSREATKDSQSSVNQDGPGDGK